MTKTKEKIFRVVRSALGFRDAIISTFTVAGAIIFGSSLTAFAAIPDYQTVSFTPDDIRNSMCNVVDWMFYFLIVLSVIMVLVAGYLFLTAGDDTEKVSKARKTITYAAIAIVVALAAKGFPMLIATFVGAGGNGSLSC
jgi:cytochrome bd-type quinol oxidase subunit 2